MSKLKQFIKMIVPQLIINFIIGRKSSQNYKIIKNPDLTKLKNKYQTTWQDTSLPSKQLKLVKNNYPILPISRQ